MARHGEGGMVTAEYGIGAVAVAAPAMVLVTFGTLAPGGLIDDLARSILDEALGWGTLRRLVGPFVGLWPW